MDQSNSLHRLLEAADLIRMIEDLTAPAAFEKLSGASVSGLRITLRNVRESILSSHDHLASNFVNKSKAALETRSNLDQSQANPNYNSQTTTLLTTLQSENRQSENRQGENRQAENGTRSENAEALMRNTAASDPQRIQLTRRDLRASLEKMVDR